MGKAENLYADTAWVPIQTTLEIIRRYDSHRIIFGSDNPIDGADTYWVSPSGEPSLYRQYFGDLKNMLSGEDYENLMDKTARRIFGI
jgi:predicted TIM-barrel fold metal-dependent hydrolase